MQLISDRTASAGLIAAGFCRHSPRAVVANTGTATAVCQRNSRRANRLSESWRNRSFVAFRVLDDTLFLTAIGESLCV